VLFAGLRGSGVDGGAFAAQALRAGAWGVLVAPEHVAGAVAAAEEPGGGAGAVLSAEDPLLALQTLAHAWAGELRAGGAHVVAITGSTGKTSTKDILAALLSLHMRTAATPANLNTEIGVPLAILGAPPGTECVVLEMAMRGAGQIAQLTAIAEPDVGVIVNVGPAHLELLGSLEAIAAAKAELIAGLRPGACAVLPAGEPLLEAHLRDDLRTITFGDGGDVSLVALTDSGVAVVEHDGERFELRPSFAQAHNLRNLLAAMAVARALGIRPAGELNVTFSGGRGQRIALAGGVTVIDDCYNANPMSMRAALDDLADTAPGRTVAVLGDMLELGAQGPELHREVGRHAAARGVDVIVAVGELGAEIARAFGGEMRLAEDAPAAARLVPRLLAPGDTVLVKASRGIGLELLVQALTGSERFGEGAGAGAGAVLLTPGAGRGRR